MAGHRRGSVNRRRADRWRTPPHHRAAPPHVLPAPTAPNVTSTTSTSTAASTTQGCTAVAGEPQCTTEVGGDRRAEVPARVDLVKNLGDAGVSLAQYRYPMDEMQAFAAAVCGESRTAARNTDGGRADTETVTKAAAPGLPELAWSGEPDRETTPAEPPQSADEAHERLATPDDRRPYNFSWRDTRVRAALLILLGAAAVVGVVVLVGAPVPQDRGAPTKEPTASPVAVPAVAPITVTAAPLPAPPVTVTAPPRVIAPAPAQIFMETTEPEIQPPVPGPSIPTVPPHGYVPILPSHGRVPILTPAPDDPCHPNC